MIERMHSEENIDLAGLIKKIKRRRNKKHGEKRVRLKGKYFGTEGETTTKALIAKIKGKIRKKEDNKGILSDIMENLQGEAMLWLNEWMMRNPTGRAEQLLKNMKKRFLQGLVQQEVCNLLWDMWQFKKETVEGWRERIERTARKAGIKSDNMIVKEAFIRGLANTETKKTATRATKEDWKILTTKVKVKDKEAKKIATFTAEKEKKEIVALLVPRTDKILEETVKKILKALNKKERENEKPSTWKTLT